MPLLNKRLLVILSFCLVSGSTPPLAPARVSTAPAHQPTCHIVVLPFPALPLLVTHPTVILHDNASNPAFPPTLVYWIVINCLLWHEGPDSHMPLVKTKDCMQLQFPSHLLATASRPNTSSTRHQDCPEAGNSGTQPTIPHLRSTTSSSSMSSYALRRAIS